MKRAVLLYSAAIAAAALTLQWLEYRYAVRALSTEVYIGAVAVGFTALGLWAGYRLTSRGPKTAFEKNDRAIAALGISGRELEVLELLAQGSSNKEIARKLRIGVSTVKNHVHNILDKLQVCRRGEAAALVRSQFHASSLPSSPRDLASARSDPRQI